jgi:hypothetical protein
MNDLIFDEKSLSIVRQISKKVLSISENTLHLFNILEQRTYTAEYQMEMYKTLQFEKEKMLSEIRTQINKQ